MHHTAYSCIFQKIRNMKLRHPINLHKGMTAFVVLGMMWWFQNVSVAAWIYLALHGSYGLLWLYKDYTYGDRQWQRNVSSAYGLFVFLGLALYWIAPFVLISQFREPAQWVIALAIALNLGGTVLHFGSDAQKYYTLKYQPGLITDGFFRYTRNPNYLGECMIYMGFAILPMHWAGFIGIAGFFLFIFIPNMLRKDRSLSRFPGFDAYRRRTGLFLPKIG